jgi:hypothetical protein
VGTNETKTETFKGVVVTAIRLDTLGNLLKNQLFPEFESSMVLMDKNRMILYASNQSFIGKNIFGEEFQSRLSTLLSPKLHNLLNEFLKPHCSVIRMVRLIFLHRIEWLL